MLFAVHLYRRVLLLLLAIQPAIVQAVSESSAEFEPVLMEITVTGERLGRTLAETNSSIGLLNAEDIALGSEVKMHDLAAQFGNVLRAQSDRQIAIRGVLQNGIAGEGETISVYVDGVALPQRAANFGGPLSAFDLAQVEILRGPQSTSQGRNSLAGAVILRSQDPTPYWGGRVRLVGSDPKGHQVGIAGGGPLIKDLLSFRVTVEDRYDEGNVYNLTRREPDAAREDTNLGRIKFLLTPEGNRYRALLSVTRSDNEFGDNIHDSTRGERTATADARYSETYRSDVGSLEQTLRLGPAWALTAVSGYVQGRDYRDADYDRTERPAGTTTYALDDEQFSQEIRFNMDYAKTRGVFGLYYSQNAQYALSTGNDVLVCGGACTLNGYVDNRVDLRTMALFSEVDWLLGSKFRLSTGLRLNREDSQRLGRSEVDVGVARGGAGQGVPLLPGFPIPDPLTDVLGQAAPDQVPPDYAVAGDKRFNVLLPKLGVTWLFSPLNSVGLTYQEGYRSGGTSISFFGGTRSDYEPEFTQTLELSARTSWLQDTLSWNVNVFYTRWRDQQVTLGDPTSFYTTTVNAGRSHLSGGESELVWRFLPRWESFVSLGLLDTEFDEFVNQGDDYAGNAFPYAPKFSGTFGVGFKAWQNFDGQISMQYIDDYYGGAANSNDQEVPARTLLHAKAGYEWAPGLRTFVYGRNLGRDANIQDRFAINDRLAKRYGEALTVGGGIDWSF